MMNLKCIECEAEFEGARFRGYCDDCIQAFAQKREKVHRCQHPAKGICADGKFVEGSAQTCLDPVSKKEVCGICGSSEIEPGYGLGSGYGIGSYVFCEECYAFLNFCEDAE